MDVLNCPLCCDGTFSNKDELVLHLNNYAASLKCPVCSKYYGSVSLLVQHLSNDGCVGADRPEQNENLHEYCSGNDDHSYTQNLTENLDITTIEDFASLKKNIQYTETPDPMLPALSNENSNDVYGDLINKPMLPESPMDEQKITQEEQNHFVIVNHNGAPAIMSADNILQQNSDGSISLTTLRNKESEKDDSDTVIKVVDQEIKAETNEELYKCSTCCITFTSILEHIQNYHSEQDVVVEVNDNKDDSSHLDNGVGDLPLKDDLDVSRRVITDSGMIIETPLEESPEDVKNDNIQEGEDCLKSEEKLEESEDADFTKHYIQIDKFTEELVTSDTKFPLGKSAYHQVVIKEMVTVDGDQKIKLFYCTACQTYVTDLNEFRAIPCKQLRYPCKHCPASFETAKSLTEHMKSHKDIKKVLTRSTKLPSKDKEDSGPFKCEVCGTVFASNKSLKLHKRMHDPHKVRPIEPPVSEAGDGTEPSGDMFFCIDCQKLIPLGYQAVHIDSHKNSEAFNCYICNKKFTSADYLLMHMNVHNIEKAPQTKSDKELPYNCVYCDRRFSRPHEKVKHERIHTGEKPHVCDICGKSFRVSYCLTLHMRTHTGVRPYECKVCGKRFKAHSVYNHHLLTHSDVRAYKCPYCPKAFKTAVQLAGHKNSHTKPFSCKHCNRPFASLYAVRVHTETHRLVQNNLKFNCELCGASYARAFALKDHMKQAHNTEEEQKNLYQVEKIYADEEEDE